MIIRLQPLGTDFVGLFLLLAKGKLYYSKYLGGGGFGNIIKDVPSKAVEADSHLLGIFYAGNSKGIIGSLPGLGAKLLDTKYTALGNLVVANDKGALISPLIKGLKKKIETELGVKATIGSVAGLDITGALVIANNKGACVHSEASEKDLKLVEKALGVPVDVATICKSGYLGAMATVNDEVLVASTSIMAPEMAHIMDVLEID